MQKMRLAGTAAAVLLSMSCCGTVLAQADKDVRADRAADQSISGRPAIQAPGYRPPGNRPPNSRPPSYRPPPGYGQPYYGRPPYHGPGGGPDHAFYPGYRLPPYYRSRTYVVDDWRAHHLRRPPPGYYWVQTGTDYLLVAVATGIIADILLNH
jgi:Ni/Co efflux regulator RcnB